MAKLGAETAETTADASATSGVAFIDGRYCPIAEAKISVLDWGFLRSDATYDVAHVWQGRFFRLDAHLDRFERSMAKLRLQIPQDRAAIAEILHECVRRSGLHDAYVEMICTRGVARAGSRDPRQADNRLIAFAIPFGWILRPEERDRGLNVVVASVERIPPESVDPTVKNYHWLDLVQGLFEAYDRGGENVLLKDRDGHITEGPGFNVFVVRDGLVATPDRGVLEGITRRSALELCAELEIPTEIRPVAADELAAADELFATSTAGGIMPITRVDGAAVGDGRPGPMTARLIALYWDKHSDPAWSTPVAYG
ncbi:MAG: aminotransferase class IV [Alphaproteobacteria bacterium]|nr:aminotransferase class IV [Alphaproteobacteria bacterium]